MDRDDGPPLSEAFVLIGQLAEAVGGTPWNKHPGCWEFDVDADWKLAVNGHPEERTTTKGTPVAPFVCCVEYRGWPAGVLSPFGGMMTPGPSAGEDDLIAALSRRLAAIPSPPPEASP